MEAKYIKFGIDDILEEGIRLVGDRLGRLEVTSLGMFDNLEVTPDMSGMTLDMAEPISRTLLKSDGPEARFDNPDRPGAKLDSPDKPGREDVRLRVPEFGGSVSSDSSSSFGYSGKFGGRREVRMDDSG